MAVFPSAQFKPAANIETPEQKKQKRLLIIFAAVILISIMVVYFGVFSSGNPDISKTGESTNAPAENVVSQQDIPSLEGVSFDFSVFNDPRFSVLSDFSSGIDISSIEKGRRNPFK